MNLSRFWLPTYPIKNNHVSFLQQFAALTRQHVWNIIYLLTYLDF